MTRKPDDGPLPPRKARNARWKELTNAIAALPADEQWAAMEKLLSSVAAHPDSGNKRIIEEYLQAAHLRPELQTSPELTRLVMLFRDILHQFVPGETLEMAMEPVHTLMSRNGGGSSSGVDKEQVRRYHARLGAESDATTQTAVRFGISTSRVRQILRG